MQRVKKMGLTVGLEGALGTWRLPLPRILPEEGKS